MRPEFSLQRALKYRRDRQWFWRKYPPKEGVEHQNRKWRESKGRKQDTLEPVYNMDAETRYEVKIATEKNSYDRGGDQGTAVWAGAGKVTAR